MADIAATRRHKFLLCLYLTMCLLIGSVQSVAYEEESSDFDYYTENVHNTGSNVEGPLIQLTEQQEVAALSAGTRGIRTGAKSGVSTPCGNPPAIQNGFYTLITMSISNDLGSKTYLVTYNCKDGYRLSGEKPTMICSDYSNHWDPPPQCVRDNNGRFDVPDPSRCLVYPSSVAILACFPNVVIKWRYASNSQLCERYLSCGTSTDGFLSREACQRNCIRTQAPATTTTRQPTMSGGRLGSQCIKDAPPNHSSCLEDSPYLEETLLSNITEILKEHNDLRDNVNPPAAPRISRLIWDEELAISAERWSAQCRAAHNSRTSRAIPNKWRWVGQNICVSRRQRSWTQCIASWSREVRNWAYGVGATKEGATVGHYTQIIWAKTTHIGCGVAKCNRGRWRYIMTCNYGPGGNVGGRQKDPFSYPYESPFFKPSTTIPTTTRTTTTTRTRRTRRTRGTRGTTTTPRQTRPTTVPDTRMSGGLRGPQCLPGVNRRTHSSCKDDSENIVQTYRFRYQEILDIHNQVRQQVWPPAVSMPDLQWSEELAISAERWGAQCRIAHNSKDERKLPQWPWVGQNIRFSTRNFSWTRAIINWADEVKNFKYGIGPIRSTATVGHYTQMIWAKTTHVGCGKVQCTGIFWNYVYVCNYGPGGNVGVNGQSPFLKPYEAVPGNQPTRDPVTFLTTRPTRRPTTTTTTTTRRPVTRPTLPPSNSGMSGGLRGSQCLPGVSSSHASCLEDSRNLVRTFRFEIEEVLRVHNQYRRSVQPMARYMPDLKYDNELAISAERWAAQCPNGHDSATARTLPRWSWVGQNICWKSGADETWTECITAWADERFQWQYGVGAVPSTAVVGHYTQIVWADTTHVGCGKAKCSGTNWEYTLVCNYGPGGNIGSGNRSPYAIPYARA